MAPGRFRTSPRHSTVRSEWYHAVRRFFERYDYFIVPTAQPFAFDIEMHIWGARWRCGAELTLPLSLRLCRSE